MGTANSKDSGKGRGSTYRQGKNWESDSNLLQGRRYKKNYVDQLLEIRTTSGGVKDSESLVIGSNIFDRKNRFQSDTITSLQKRRIKCKRKSYRPTAVKPSPHDKSSSGHNKPHVVPPDTPTPDMKGDFSHDDEDELRSELSTCTSTRTLDFSDINRNDNSEVDFSLQCQESMTDVNSCEEVGDLANLANLLSKDILPDIPKEVQTRVDVKAQVSNLENLNMRIKEETMRAQVRKSSKCSSENNSQCSIEDVTTTAAQASGSTRQTLDTPPTPSTSETTVPSYASVRKKFEEGSNKNGLKNEEIFRHMEELGLGFVQDGKWVPTDIISRTIWNKVEQSTDGCDAKWGRRSKTFVDHLAKDENKSEK